MSRHSQIIDSQFAALEAITKAGGGWVYIDWQSDSGLRERIETLVRENRSRSDFFVLDFREPAESHTYNPLHQGSIAAKVSRLLSLLPADENPSPESTFEQDQAMSALRGVMSAMATAGITPTLKHLLELLNTDSMLDVLLRALPPEVSAMFGSVAPNSEGVRSALTGVVSRLNQLALGNTSYLLNSEWPQVKFTDIIQLNQMCFVIMPPTENNAFLGNIANLVMSDIQDALTPSGINPFLIRSAPFVLLQSPSRLSIEALAIMNRHETFDPAEWARKCAQFSKEASVGCGLSDVLWARNMKSSVDAAMDKLPEQFRTLALEIACKLGYDADAFKQDPDSCCHGLDPYHCPAGCGDIED